METINNATAAVTRAVRGGSDNNDQSNQSGNEPVSGQTGNTSGGEPYDAGNQGNLTNTDTTNTDTTRRDTANTDMTNTNTTSAAGNTDTIDKSTSGVSQSGPKQTDMPGNTPATGPIRPEHETDKTGVTSLNQPSNKFGDDKPSSSNESSGPGPEPSVGADPASGAQDTQKQQGADRPEDEPNSDEHSRIQEAKKEAEEAQNVDTSGPGPKPLSETRKAGGEAKPSGGDDDGDDDGPQKESHGEGTGEKWVKSSGMKADGGDFDASAPGAGREADRLLEEKGIHHEAGSTGPTAEDNKSDPLEDKLNKPSLGEKLKAKLHVS